MNAIDPLSRNWLPRGRLARRTRGLLLGGVWLRWLTWRQAHELDRQLARGTDPIVSDELSLRAGQLASARSRGRFACVLRGAVELADAPYDPFRMGRPVIRRAQVRENRQLLLELADRLRAGGFLGVQGLAMTSLLVGDGVSPLFSKAECSSLKGSVNHALLALDRGLAPLNSARRSWWSHAFAPRSRGWSLPAGRPQPPCSPTSVVGPTPWWQL